MPEQGPDWFLVATEACGGGTPDLGYVLGVSLYIRGFGVGNKSVKEICPRGNNKVLYISLYHDKCLLFMLELY